MKYLILLINQTRYMLSFADMVIEFLKDLKYSDMLPPGISIMNRFSNTEFIAIPTVSQDVTALVTEDPETV